MKGESVFDKLKDLYYGLVSKIGILGIIVIIVFVLASVMAISRAVIRANNLSGEPDNAVSIKPDTESYPKYDYSARPEEASLSTDTAVVQASAEPDKKNNMVFPAVFNAAITKVFGKDETDGEFTFTDDTTAEMLSKLTDEELIEIMGPVFKAEQEKMDILASISLAQLIVESKYSRSALAISSNNVFSMKTDLSGNTWTGSAWDGISNCVLRVTEQDTFGNPYTVDASYRKYPSVRKCIDDHSNYLLGAMVDGHLRYEGIKGCKDYKAAAAILKNGGYATSLTYASDLINTVESLNLTRFDL